MIGTVLVIDDNAEMIGVATEALEGAGHRVLAALDGTRGVLIADEAAPDLVLLDAVMPDIDGFETLLRLRRLPGAATRPVIFVTGLAETDEVIRALGAGAVDYLVKPVEPREMLARVAVHLALARTARSTRAALELAGCNLFAVDGAGALLWATDAARALLPTPPALADAAGALIRDDDEASVDVALHGHAGPSLRLGRVGRLGPAEILLRIDARRASNDEQVLRTRLGVTAREAEVLTWLARGKTNRDIADVLGLSPRTVNKHLEGIYTKLGVENRSAAVVQCLHALRA